MCRVRPRIGPRRDVSRVLEEVAAQVAQRRQTVMLNGRDALRRVAHADIELGVHAVVGVPLLHGGQLLGVVAVLSNGPGKQFTDDDAELLEMLGGLAASTFVALERNHAVEELRLQTDRLRRLIETTSDAILVADGDLRLSVWNRGAEELLGWPREEVLGTILPFVDAERRDAATVLWHRVLHRGEIIANHEAEWRTRDGRRVLVLATLSPVRDHLGNVVAAVAIAKDMTIQRALEEQRRLLARLEERESIGMDLHDNTMQSLYGAVLAVGAADRLLEQHETEQARGRLRQVVDQLNGTIHDLRAFIFDLDVEGTVFEQLHGGLAHIAEEARRLALVHVELAVDERAESILGREMVAQLLAVAREATSNVIRHAAANELRLKVALEDRHVLLDVIDDGRGFDVDDAHSHGVHGLANMSERIRRVGGQMSLLSGHGQGTRVHVQLPVTEPTDP